MKRKFNRLNLQSLAGLVAILMIGLFASLAWPDNEWFARSGSVVVAFAVVQILRWRIEYTSSSLTADVAAALVEVFGARKIRKKNPDLSEAEIDQRAKEHASRSFAEQRRQLKLEESLFWYIEALLVFIGTLVWGFGDLVV